VAAGPSVAGMRLSSGRRRLPPDQVAAARARVAAINGRPGWVPRVPDDVPARPGRHARRDVGDAAGTAIAAAESLAEQPADPLVDGPVNADIPGSGPPASGPAHSRVSGAVADRLPLPVRALMEGLPAGVRHGWFEFTPRHALVVVLVILLGLAVTALLVGWGRPRVAAVGPGPGGAGVATSKTAAVPPPGAAAGPGQPEILVVHVTGKVGRPGIVELPAGSRVVDAIEATGGMAGDVDLTTLNLARLVVDGEQLFVGVEPPAGAMPGGLPGGLPGAPVGGMVSINTATPEQLATLPGIGPALAGRIVQWREQHGRFTAVEELLEVSGIGPAKYEALVGLVAL
jgi:competence protein ComEA